MLGRNVDRKMFPRSHHKYRLHYIPVNSFQYNYKTDQTYQQDILNSVLIHVYTPSSYMSSDNCPYNDFHNIHSNIRGIYHQYRILVSHTALYTDTLNHTTPGHIWSTFHQAYHKRRCYNFPDNFLCMFHHKNQCDILNRPRHLYDNRLYSSPNMSGYSCLQNTPVYIHNTCHLPHIFLFPNTALDIRS